MYSKHGINRVVERVVLNNQKSNKRYKKNQKKKLLKKAVKKYKKDIENHFAYLNASNGIRYYYANLDEDNNCNKYIRSYYGKLITVVKVNFDDELRRYHNIKDINGRNYKYE